MKTFAVLVAFVAVIHIVKSRPTSPDGTAAADSSAAVSVQVGTHGHGRRPIPDDQTQILITPPPQIEVTPPPQIPVAPPAQNNPVGTASANSAAAATAQGSRRNVLRPIPEDQPQAPISPQVTVIQPQIVPPSNAFNPPPPNGFNPWMPGNGSGSASASSSSSASALNTGPGGASASSNAASSANASGRGNASASSSSSAVAVGK